MTTNKNTTICGTDTDIKSYKVEDFTLTQTKWETLYSFNSGKEKWRTKKQEVKNRDT